MRHEVYCASGIQFVLPSNMDLSNCLVFIGGLLYPECAYTLFQEVPNTICHGGIQDGQKSLILRSTVTDADIIVIAL